MDSLITNKFGVQISQKAMREIFRTKEILKELNLLKGLVGDHEELRRNYLVEELNSMWDGGKYNISARPEPRLNDFKLSLN